MMPQRSPKLGPRPVLQGKIMNPQSAWLKKCLQLCQNRNPQKTGICQQNWQQKNWKTCKQKSEDEKSRLRQYLKMAQASGKEIEMVRMLRNPGRVMKCGILFLFFSNEPADDQNKNQTPRSQWLEHDIKNSTPNPSVSKLLGCKNVGQLFEKYIYHLEKIDG